MDHQRLAPRLAAGVAAQLAVKRREPQVDRVDHRQRDSDLLPSRGWQRQLADPGAVLAREQVGSLRHPVVIEHSLHPLLPLAAIVDERMTEPDPRAQIKDVVGPDPRLRQPACLKQLAQMPGVRPIVLGALLVPAQRAGLRRLGQMRTAPTRRSSSTTNRQPVVASSAASNS